MRPPWLSLHLVLFLALSHLCLFSVLFSFALADEDTPPQDGRLTQDAQRIPGCSAVTCKTEQARELFCKGGDWPKAEAMRSALAIHCLLHDKYTDQIAAQHMPEEVREQDAQSLQAYAGLSCSPMCEHCEARGGLWVDVPEREASDAVAEYFPLQPCDMNSAFPAHDEELQQKWARFSLATWLPELTRLNPLETGESRCDVIVEEPTLIIKPDAHANLYHAMCDFVNLYISAVARGWWPMEVKNATAHPEPPPARLRIMYHDLRQRSAEFRSPFAEAYRALTALPVEPLGRYAGQRVCFRDAVLSTLPRGTHNLFFNMPLGGVEEGCRAGDDGLLPRFARHLWSGMLGLSLQDLRRMARGRGNVRILLVSRSSGQGQTSGTRHIINEDAVVEKLKTLPNVEVEQVSFDFSDHVPFAEQVRIAAQADVLVGMHGAGLTHTLWTPPWAALVELFHCGDFRCYRNLAALSGHFYVTGDPDSVIKRRVPAARFLEKPELWTARAQDSHMNYNYELDVDVVHGLVQATLPHVRSHLLSPHRRHAGRQQRHVEL